jgi:hypothetical protein
MLAHRSRISGLIIVAAGLCASVFSGCTTAFDRNRDTLRGMHEQGAYSAAAVMLDDPGQKDLYSERNRLLYWLDRGAIALALDDPQTTIDLLEKAEAWAEVHREPSTGDELSRWLLNDTMAPYYAEPYEDIYVNVLKLLAQLEAGRVSGGATVEARRMAGKADVLRDRYVKSRQVVDDRLAQERSGAPRSMTSPPGERTVDANVEGEFLESTLGTYLTAITFLKDNDANGHAVASRRLLTAVALQRSLQGADSVDERKFEYVSSLAPSDVNLVVVGLSGRAPYKVPERVGPIPLYEWPIYFELPQLVGGSEEVGAVRVIAEPLSGTSGTTVREFPLDKIEDMRAVAMENHRRQMPLIYTRTLLRSQIKAAAAFAATQAAKNSVHRGGERAAVQIGMILAGLAFVGLTEKADLRCWTFLPGRADVGSMRLEPGKYRVRTEYLSRAGGVVYVPAPHDVEIGAGTESLTTIVEHYWR